MNKTLVILNPAARGEKAARLKDKVREVCSMASLELTSRPGDARRIAAEAVAAGVETVVAAGGDGTINEVVNGVAGSGARMGILPMGTVNVLAKEIGIPEGNLAAAWEVVERGHTLALDLPEANGQYFIQLAGVGLDAEVVRRTNLDLKKTLGPLSYILTLVQLAASKPPRVIVEAPGWSDRECCFALIGNGRLYGGPFPLFKRASLYDGLLDVVVFKNQSHWDVIRYFQAIAFGTHPDLHDVEYFQTPSLRVRSNSDVPVELDGEVAGTLPCEFRLAPHKLHVLAPGAAD
ncbi:MAG: diacylglycerol/lipid kinase family protein [Verrucomicrobiota bacterium]